MLKCILFLVETGRIKIADQTSYQTVKALDIASLLEMCIFAALYNGSCSYDSVSNPLPIHASLIKKVFLSP